MGQVIMNSDDRTSLLQKLPSIPKKPYDPAKYEPEYKKYMFNQDTNWLNIIVLHVKEFLATITFLLCVSRIGGFDYFAMPSILFVVLMMYGLPILNPAAWVCLRAGPYLNTQNMVRTVFTIVALLGFQLFGVGMAALIRQSLDYNFGKEILSVSDYRFERRTNAADAEFGLAPPPPLNPGSGVNSMILISPNGSYGSAPNCTYVTQYPYETTACLRSPEGWAAWNFLEEMADTFFFALGVIYLYNLAEKMNDSEREKKKAVEDPSGNDRSKDMDLGPDDVSTTTVLLALMISLLALGLNYMFPTANHGLHITFFKIFLASAKGEGVSWELHNRAWGAVLGGLLTLLWYWGNWVVFEWMVADKQSPEWKGSAYGNWGYDRSVKRGNGLLYTRMAMRKPSPGLASVYIPRGNSQGY